jgi:hypothetical protein
MPPPMNVGYVTMDPSRRGGVDVQGQAGGGSWLPDPLGAGGTAMHVEPFVTEHVSIPIGTGLGGSELGGNAPLRVGVRHRAARVFAWGAGIGPSVMFDRSSIWASGVADVEVILGVQKPRVGFSFGLRPALSFDAHNLFVYVLGDPTLAITLVGQTALTIAVPSGGWVDTSGTLGGAGFMSGALGVHHRF